MFTFLFFGISSASTTTYRSSPFFLMIGRVVPADDGRLFLITCDDVLFLTSCCFFIAFVLVILMALRELKLFASVAKDTIIHVYMQ